MPPKDSDNKGTKRPATEGGSGKKKQATSGVVEAKSQTQKAASASSDVGGQHAGAREAGVTAATNDAAAAATPEAGVTAATPEPEAGVTAAKFRPTRPGTFDIQVGRARSVNSYMRDVLPYVVGRLSAFLTSKGLLNKKRRNIGR